MEKQPHIYTMPEQFLHDKGVPARWKVLATVQGFWIAGLTAYATNEWLQNKLGYSRRQIQHALDELEKMDLIFREIKGMSRVIYPGGATRLHGVQSRVMGGCSPESGEGAAGLHHNSVSNSENTIPFAGAKKSEILDFEEDLKFGSEEDEVKAHKQVNRDTLKVFEAFKNIHPEWVLWRKRPAQRDAAKALLARYGLERTLQFIAASQEVKGKGFAPDVHSPYDLLRKLPNLKSHEERGNRETD